MERSSDQDLKEPKTASNSQPQIQKVSQAMLQHLFESTGNLTGY